MRTTSNNFIHPVVKLLFTFSFVIAAGLTKNLPVLLCIALIWLVSSKAAGLSLKESFSALRAFRFLLAFTFIIQLFVSIDGHLTLPDRMSFYNSCFFTVRLCVVIAFSAFFAAITPQLDIVRLFYLIFTPLKIFRINPGDVALSMLIALRFIPLLYSEGEKILDSQRLRGVLPEKGQKGSRLKIIKASASLVIPLFVRTFYYASQIAVTLNFRRHDGSFFKLPKMQAKDYLQAFSVTLLAASIGFAGVNLA